MPILGSGAGRRRRLRALSLAGVLFHVAPSVFAQSTPGTDGAAGPGWSLRGEMRQQYERFSNEEWGAEPGDPDGYLLQRYMLSVNRRMGDRVNVLVEVKSGIESGRAGGPRGPDEDRFDVHQSYADVTIGSVTFRIGRQELQFGSSRLVSVRDLNVRQSFDAGMLTARRPGWRVDAFAALPAKTRVGALDDGTDDARRLWGVYAVRQPRAARTPGVDVYYLGYQRQEAHFDSAHGTERRHSIGARVWSTRNLDYNVELVGQWGTLSHASIRAWTMASDTGYRLPVRFRPRVGVRADVTSGDRNPDDGTQGTFNALFPRGAYFGLMASAGPANHIDVHPQIDATIGRGVSATAGWLVLWRKEVADGIYSASGRLLRSAAGTHSRFVGHSPSVTLAWDVGTKLSLLANVSTFSAGTFIRESGSDLDIGFVRVSTTYRF